jgi:hypothetical protein
MIKSGGMFGKCSIFLAGLLSVSTAYAQNDAACDYDSVLKDIPSVGVIHAAKPLAMHAYVLPLGDYTVQAFSPDSWVSFKQEQAKKTLTTFSPSAFDMKNVLLIGVSPPSQLSGIAQDGHLNISVVNAVLRSTDQSVTVVPLCSVHVPVSFQNNLGGRWSFDSMFLLFDLRDVTKQLADGKSLEVSVVIGTGKIHDFVLEQKQLSILELH